MFRFAGIDWQIFRSRVFAHDHSLVNVLLRSDKKPAALLNVIERVSHADSRFHRHHHTTTASTNLALERRVFAEQMTHQSFASRQIYEVGFKANEASCRNDCLE